MLGGGCGISLALYHLLGGKSSVIFSCGRRRTGFYRRRANGIRSLVVMYPD